MIIHDIYSYGQLFCFSGLDGETSRNDDFVGMLMDEPVTIRFHFDSTITFLFLRKSDGSHDISIADCRRAVSNIYLLSVLFTPKNFSLTDK